MGNESLVEMANELECNIGSWPIPYLGVKVGRRVKGVEAWKGVIDRVNKHLCRWDTESISMGGRITIIKSVLSALLSDKCEIYIIL